MGALDGAWAKLARAEHHPEMLEGKIADFIDRQPVRIAIDRDLDQTAYIFHAYDVASTDFGWGLILGDCAHNARAAMKSRRTMCGPDS